MALCQVKIRCLNLKGTVSINSHTKMQGHLGKIFLLWRLIVFSNLKIIFLGVIQRCLTKVNYPEKIDYHWQFQNSPQKNRFSLAISKQPLYLILKIIDVVVILKTTSQNQIWSSKSYLGCSETTYLRLNNFDWAIVVYATLA